LRPYLRRVGNNLYVLENMLVIPQDREDKFAVALYTPERTT
jgi:hypothetical protein